MEEPRSAAQEASDPSTSPERLLELTEKRPQLHRLLVLNPSTPAVAREWILATNPWAKRAHEETAQQAPAGDHAPEDDQVPEDDRVSESERPPEPEAAPAEPDEVSVWGDFSEDAVWGDAETTPAPAPAPAPPVTPTPTVRIAKDAGVVPLGPAAVPRTSPAAGSSSPAAAAWCWPSCWCS